MSEEILAFCISCAKEFYPSSPDVVLCPDCGGPPEKAEPTPASTNRTYIGPSPAPQKPTPTILEPQADRTLAESEVPAEWQLGDELLDTYTVSGLLGEGGMGKVYRVHHKSWNIDLAVKSPRTEFFQTQTQRDLFIAEAETWVNLGLHQHIVSCYYVRALGGIPRVFAELVEGGSLEDWIKQGKITTCEQALDIAIQFAWGLAYAHEQGLVHRDVKPANVLMTPDGIAKVTDFGLARASKGMTPAYASPEQAEAQFIDIQLTPQADIWSWGLSVLEMFAGSAFWVRPALPDYAWGQVAPQALEHYLAGNLENPAIRSMPTKLADLLKQCFYLKPDRRQTTLSAVAHQLITLYSDTSGHSYTRHAPQETGLEADSINNRALSFYDLGRASEAIGLWQANLRANPGHLETTYNLGLVQWRAAQTDDASLLRGLQAAAVSADSWRQAWLVGQIHLERGDISQVLAFLDTLPAEAAARPEVMALRRQAQDTENPGHRLQLTFQGHRGGISSVQLSRDNRYALSGGIDCSLILWDLASGVSLRTLKGHQGEISSVCLADNGELAVSGSKDGSIKLWDFVTGLCLRTLPGHSAAVTSVALTRDMRVLLSASADKKLRLCEPATGNCLRTFTGHSGGINSVCVSRDGKFALSGSGDWTVKLWDLGTGSCLRTFEGHTGYVVSVAISDDGRYALSGGDRSVRLWDIPTGECLQVMKIETSYIGPVALSGDGRYALAGTSGFGSHVNLWDTQTGKRLHQFEGHTQAVTTVALSDDGNIAISGSDDRTLKLWDTTNGTCLRTMGGHNDYVSAIYPSRDGALAVSGSGDKSAILWDTSSGVNSQVYLGHTGRITSVCLSQDRRFVLTAGAEWFSPPISKEDKTLKLWEAATGKCFKTFVGHSDGLAAAVLSPDSRLAYSASYDGTIKYWDVETGNCLRTIDAHAGGVFCLHLSGDGKYALTGGRDKTLKLWELESAKCIRTFTGHEGLVDAVCLSKDGKRALSGSGDKTLKLWNVDSGECLQTFRSHTGEVESVCLTHKGDHAFSASRDRTFKIWDVITGRCLSTFESPASSAAVITLCDGDNTLLVGNSNGRIDRWVINFENRNQASMAVSRLVTTESAATIDQLLSAARTARQKGDQAAELQLLRRARAVPGFEHSPEIRDAWSQFYRLMKRTTLRSAWLARTFEGHTGFVTTVCLSLDGRFAVSGSWDKTIRLWDTSNGKCLRRLEGHTGTVCFVGLSNDGQFVLSGGEDSSLKLWDFSTGRLLRSFTGHQGYVNSAILTSCLRFVISGSGDGPYRLISGQIKVWDTASGRCLRTFEGGTHWVTSLCLTGDERYVLSGGRDGIPKLWKISAGKGVRKYNGHSAEVYSVCNSRDGQTALSGSGDGTLKLWDLATMKCLRTFAGHQSGVSSVCLTADGGFALSGNLDNTLKIWDTATGSCLDTLEGHTGALQAVSISLDGRFALSGSYDRTVKLWELDWEVEAVEPADWDEHALPYLTQFLTVHTPYLCNLPQNRTPNIEEYARALTRQGQPNWSEKHFGQLMDNLGMAGFGYLRPDGVRRKLEELARKSG